MVLLNFVLVPLKFSFGVEEAVILVEKVSLELLPFSLNPGHTLVESGGKYLSVGSGKVPFVFIAEPAAKDIFFFTVLCHSVNLFQW